MISTKHLFEMPFTMGKSGNLVAKKIVTKAITAPHPSSSKSRENEEFRKFRERMQK